MCSLMLLLVSECCLVLFVFHVQLAMGDPYFSRTSISHAIEILLSGVLPIINT